MTNTLPVDRPAFPPGEPVPCPAFDFAAELRYDESGLIVDYPGIAGRYVSP